jgi:Homeodomain-like domain
MGSVSKPRCARGSNCYHVRKFGVEKPPTVAHEGDLCEKCQKQHVGVIQSPKKRGWLDEVIEALEALYETRPTPQRPDRASLWDLFNLNPFPVRQDKSSDRGEALRRLSTKTLAKLRDWLEVNGQEAVNRYGAQRYTAVTGHISAFLAARRLFDGKWRFTDNSGALPIQGFARGPSGRIVDIIAPIRAAFRRREIQLSRKPRFVTERELEKQLASEFGKSRSTIRRWFQRYQELGLHKGLLHVTPEELFYVRKGEKPGQKLKDQDV